MTHIRIELFAWIKWIIMADLPITIVENTHYRKHSLLKPTTYKTVTMHMEKLLGIVRGNIKRGLPQTFGLIFDGWSCDYSEHYIGIFATSIRDDGNVVKIILDSVIKSSASHFIFLTFRG